MRELRDMTVKELEGELSKMRAELMRTHVDKGSRYTSDKGNIKRDIARVLTVLRERGVRA